MNKSNIFDRTLFNEDFKKTFSPININNINIQSNPISKWKNNILRFEKSPFLTDIKDNENWLIISKFTSGNNKKLINKSFEYINWVIENIIR